MPNDTSHGHGEWIDVLSWSWGGSQSGTYNSATFDGKFIVEYATHTLEIDFTGSPTPAIGQALLFPIINTEADKVDSHYFTLNWISADEVKITDGEGDIVGLILEPTMHDLQLAMADLLGVDGPNSGRDGNPEHRATPVDIVSFTYERIDPSGPGFDVHLAAVTGGGTGINIETEGDTTPGEAMALLRSVISKFPVDAFKFDFAGDDTEVGGGGGKVSFQDISFTKYVDSSTATLLIEASLAIPGSDPLTETVAEINVDGLNFHGTASEVFKALATLVPEDSFDLML